MDSSPPSGLVTVTIETRMGAVYQFPDMTRGSVDKLLRDNIAFQGDIILSNISRATLVLPTRIIKTLAIDGEVKWRGIDPVHELPFPGSE